MPCPVDMPGAMMLAVASVFIGRKRGIEIKVGWIEYAVLWIVVVARSGERKTPVYIVVTAPLRYKQRKLLAKYLSEVREGSIAP